LIGGLKDGDKIVAVNSVPVANYGQLVTQIRSIAPNVPTTISYVRDGQQADATVSLASVMRAPLDDPTGKPVVASALGISSTLPPGVPTDVTYRPVKGIGQAGTCSNMFGEIGTALKSRPTRMPNLWRARPANHVTRMARSASWAPADGGQSLKLGLWNLFFVIAAASTSSSASSTCFRCSRSTAGTSRSPGSNACARGSPDTQSARSGA
jgi:hypothetical protein